MPSTRFVIRAHQRIPVRCNFYYMGEEFLGKGTVTNLSRIGFRALGDHQVMPGMELVARLSLPGRAGSVDVGLALVRWVRGHWFGAKMIRLNPEAKERIGTFLSTCLRSSCPLR
ncbi:MAG: PilZ domain-containing protein [Nitrospira sp.]|nr:PilZ domain-containing protein [Nitrospira sp.]MCP9460767.1 PilZ domain-containing protein [Nitrospira sp.]MCP9474832.1 PilZ domain-containing protein [Nitrospira sp.]